MTTSSTMLQMGVHRQTVLSPSRRYRYCLWRTWGKAPGDYVVFIGLNPSTADETLDDPTIRRCVGFAKRWGYESLCMMNLFAFRATKPAALYQAESPIGPLNDDFLSVLAKGATRVVACWGNHGSLQSRDVTVRNAQLVSSPLCFGTTKAGSPKHPLYVPYETDLLPFA